jgi:hypothetical protein
MVLVDDKIKVADVAWIMTLPLSDEAYKELYRCLNK